jgi:hypothetical protein
MTRENSSSYTLMNNWKKSWKLDRMWKGFSSIRIAFRLATSRHITVPWMVDDCRDRKLPILCPLLHHPAIVCIVSKVRIAWSLMLHPYRVDYACTARCGRFLLSDRRGMSYGLWAMGMAHVLIYHVIESMLQSVFKCNARQLLIQSMSTTGLNPMIMCTVGQWQLIKLSLVNCIVA